MRTRKSKKSDTLARPPFKHFNAELDDFDTTLDDNEKIEYFPLPGDKIEFETTSKQIAERIKQLKEMATKEVAEDKRRQEGILKIEKKAEEARAKSELADSKLPDTARMGVIGPMPLHVVSAATDAISQNTKLNQKEKDEKQAGLTRLEKIEHTCTDEELDKETSKQTRWWHFEWDKLPTKQKNAVLEKINEADGSKGLLANDHNFFKKIVPDAKETLDEKAKQLATKAIEDEKDKQITATAISAATSL